MKKHHSGPQIVGKLRDGFLNQELFLRLAEARYVAGRWRLDYNHHPPYSSLGWMTPTAFAASCPTEIDGCRSTTWGPLWNRRNP